MSGEDASRRVAQFEFLSSGSKALDGLLGGGFREGRLVELFGRSNSGKSQIAMQAALVAARNGKHSLFVDTEGAFRPERLEEMARARGWDSQSALERILYLRADSSAEQMEAVTRMNEREPTKDCRLVVVDTLTRNFSLDLPGRSNLAGRQGAIDVHLSEMARDAFLNRRAYLLTNRVTFGQSHDVGIGGRTVEQLVHSSIRLQREGPMVRATMVPSGKSVLISLGEAGMD